MLWLKACPRCEGDLVLEEDMFGSFVSCLQCGHILDKETMNELMTPKLIRSMPEVEKETVSKAA